MGNPHRPNVAAILRSRRIRDRLVILCEGDHVLDGDTDSAPSPLTYGRLEHTPDSNFYKACVPRDWHNSRLPQFFNCGGRADVIHTFEDLLGAHELTESGESYLNPDKLYALVDVDLQPGALPGGYPWATTEDVHAALYRDGVVHEVPEDRHRIWVTALVHKEAFFVLPSAETCWAEGLVPHFKGAPLDLRQFHVEIARRMESDADLAQQIEKVRGRLGRFGVGPRLNASCGRVLHESWTALANETSAAEYEVLVRALLTLAKVKPVWEEIGPDLQARRALSPELFRDQLGLRVARKISGLTPAEHPLAGFFAWLKPRR